MELKRIDGAFSVCRLWTLRPENLAGDFCFFARTDEELSLVCRPENAPADAIAREDGWRAFRIQGVLDFSLIGILAPIASLLAKERIGIFAVSTYNTDYILVKSEQYEKSLAVLAEAGYHIV